MYLWPFHEIIYLQMSSMNEVCGICWGQARDLSFHVPERPQERPQLIVLPNIRRAADSSRHCIFQECMEPERNIVPEETRQEVLVRYQYFIPRSARICSLHRQEANYENLYTAEYSLNSFTSTHIEEIVFILMEGLSNISYENIQNYPDSQVQYFIGINKQQHQQILDATPRLRNTHRGSFALTALLCKLRTGDSGDRLSCLFQVPRRTLETLMSVARNILLTDYVPQFLGFSHLRREQLAARNSYIANHIFGEPNAPTDQKPAITIADATYIYTQKSSNYLFQKETYSLHKYRNLLKPFILCASDGYIIDVRGPYSATTNDATIMNNLLNETEFNDFYNENDIFIVDRGFRDCMDSLHEKGYIAHMPETREDGQSQLSTLEANRSRCVTINRWVVEAVNGRFKRDFKIFRHEYFNRGCRNLMSDFKIAAALLNAFTPPFAENIHAEQFVSIIFERLFLTNTVAELVRVHNLNRRGSWFIPIDATTISFPRLSMEELTLFACGVYQIRQARSYVGEHFRFHGVYTLEVSRERIHGLDGINPMLLRAKIKSRHSSARTYFVFIVAETNMNGRDAIISYCCNCIVGLRTVGCCSHVMSIIWYLSYARHEGMTRPAPFLDEVILRID